MDCEAVGPRMLQSNLIQPDSGWRSAWSLVWTVERTFSLRRAPLWMKHCVAFTPQYGSSILSQRANRQEEY